MDKKGDSKSVLIARSDGPGGVGSYFRAVEPHLAGVDSVIIGKRQWEETWYQRLSRFVYDYAKYVSEHFTNTPDLVHLNPSPGLKSLLREGLFLVTSKLFGCKVLLFFRGGLAQFEPTDGRLT
ncbi:MAG: hypothetical protein ABEK50_18190, partial [bacterium]